MSAARPIRLMAKAEGGARTAGRVEDADCPQLALIHGYKDELAPIVEAYGEVEIVIRSRPGMSRPVNDDRAPPSDLPSLVREMEHVMLNVAGLAQLDVWSRDEV